MSQILEFYPGDTAAISRSDRAGRLRAIREAAARSAMAGFYNISPADLDLLTGEAWPLLGGDPIDFMGSLTAITDGGQEEGCYLVSPRWVERIAGIPDVSVDLLRRRWIAALLQEYSGAALDEEELGRGLGDLITVCRNARDRESDVILVWM